MVSGGGNNYDLGAGAGRQASVQKTGASLRGREKESEGRKRERRSRAVCERHSSGQLDRRARPGKQSGKTANGSKPAQAHAEMDPHATLKQAKISLAAAAAAAAALDANKSALAPAGSPSQSGLLKQQAADIQLVDQAPPHFDRAVLVRCILSLLQDPKSRGLVSELIDSATTRVVSWPDAQSDQWYDPALLAGYQPHASPPEMDAGGPGAPPGIITSLNLYKLQSRIQSSETEYTLEALNDQWQTVLVIIYSLTAITSFILNVITVIVLARCQRSELRKYLINLSLSDLLMSCFSIPFTYTEYMLGSWIFAPLLCPIGRFVVTLSVFVSIATMTVIGINRHSAIMHPLKRKRRTKFRHWTIRKTHVILGIWLLGIAISLPEYLMFSAEPFCYNRQLYYDCRSLWPDSISDPYTVFIYLSTFVVPLALLSYLYGRIALKLYYRQMPGNVDVNRDLTMQTKRAKVVKMLLVVVSVFVVFWLPLQTFSMVMFLWPNLRGGFEYQSTQYTIFIASYFACHWLGMAHSCLNPLIYCFMNKKFRTDLHNLICGLRLRGRGAFDSRQMTSLPAAANNNHHHHHHPAPTKPPNSCSRNNNSRQKHSSSEASGALERPPQSQAGGPHEGGPRDKGPAQADSQHDQRNKAQRGADCACTHRREPPQQQRISLGTRADASAPCASCGFLGLKLPSARQLNEVGGTQHEADEREAEEADEEEELDELEEDPEEDRPDRPGDLEGRRVVLRHNSQGVAVLKRLPAAPNGPLLAPDAAQKVGGGGGGGRGQLSTPTSCCVTRV